jgi:hypothetical protein
MSAGRGLISGGALVRSPTRGYAGLTPRQSPSGEEWWHEDQPWQWSEFAAFPWSLCARSQPL